MSTHQAVVAELTAALGGVSSEAAEAAEAVDDIVTNFQILKGELDDLDAIEGVRDSFDDVRQAAVDAWTSAAEEAPDAAQKMRDYQQTVRDSIRTVLFLEDQLDNLGDDTIAEIAVAVKAGDIDRAEALIAGIADRSRPLQVAIDTDHLTAQIAAWARKFGPGSNSSGGTPAPSGAGASGPGRVTNVNVYYPPVVTTGQWARAQAEFNRLNGNH
jgi:hypothetical protein